MITLFLNGIAERLKGYRPYNNFFGKLAAGEFPLYCEGPRGVFLALLLNRVSETRKGPVVVLVPTELDAQLMERDLQMFGDNVTVLPPFGNLPYSGISPQISVMGQRVSALSALVSRRKGIVITTLRSFITPVPPPDVLASTARSIAKGEEFDPVELEEFLSRSGYLRVPRVSVPGEFALRGEVLDVFRPDTDEPVRIVFDFDVVEDIRSFDPHSQASTEKVTTVTLLPVKEMSWDAERINRLQEFMTAAKADEVSMATILESLSEQGECANEEILYSQTFDRKYAPVDYLDNECSLIVFEPERIAASVETQTKETIELYSRARRKEGGWLPRPSEIYVDLDDATDVHPKTIVLPAIASSSPADRVVKIPYDGPRSFFGNMAYFKEELKSLIEADYQITVFAESESQASRIGHLLKDYELEIIPQSISEGFTLPDLKIVAIQENEIFGRRKRVPASVHRAKSEAIDTFVELNPGDHVVHVNYGIGRFDGIERISAAGTERDYIQLEYAGEERVFIPIEQVNLIQRYIGQEGRKPRLDKLGGKSWNARKARVKKSVEDLAEMLINLYSRRKQATGFAFPADSDWQVEFEASFPFEETVDQLRCIEEVKADMELPKPMDRLICGDVGYGKTEIAMRAAFKAVMGGRQVAILAPTTILAEQHYENFIERFARYPVKIGMVSRFVPRSEQRKLLVNLAEGNLDLLIGTHRLLQKDVIFRDLGLLVIDEEQRFGVKDKERIKQLKTSIDCLTLSATPIPRTLHMSLLKIRDMSLLTTPPHNRRPIETFVAGFEEERVADAIRKEAERGGQVYYLHNRVETLESVKLFIEKLIPDVSVEVAHGQMHSKDLEDIMHRFIHGTFHVLVATTIIENGIDIPNVNTIIIDRADMYGVSQLYQLRGRVGRSERLAYAYLLYPGERALTEIAMKRLRIISDYTDLGSGFKIALKDLEIRGAGNLLGRQQHGDILSVGFDMYVRLLDQTIAEMTDEERETTDVYLELEYSGFIPDTYISESIEKMEVYKKIASVTNEEALNQLHAELQDRYGPMPDAVQSLISLAEIRVICSRLSVSSLRERRNVAEVEFRKVADISVDKVLRLIRDSGGNVTIDPKRPNVMLMKTHKIGLAEKSEFLREKLSVLL